MKKNRNYPTCVGEYQYSFCMLPKELNNNDTYKQLSVHAKYLYAHLLDRSYLSLQNHYVDRKGHPYIFFTREEAQELLGCKDNKATSTFKELVKVDLIEEHVQGKGKAKKIFVKLPLHAAHKSGKVVETKQKKETINQKRKAENKQLLADNRKLQNKNSKLKELFIAQMASLQRIADEKKKATHITVSPNTLQTVKDQVEYDYFTHNYSKAQVRLVDTVIQCIAEMKTAFRTKIKDVYYSWDTLEALFSDFHCNDLLLFVEEITPKINLKGIKNLKGYLSTALVNFIQKQQVEYALWEQSLLKL